MVVLGRFPVLLLRIGEIEISKDRIQILPIDESVDGPPCGVRLFKNANRVPIHFIAEGACNLKDGVAHLFQFETSAIEFPEQAVLGVGDSILPLPANCATAVARFWRSG